MHAHACSSAQRENCRGVASLQDRSKGAIQWRVPVKLERASWVWSYGVCRPVCSGSERQLPCRSPTDRCDRPCGDETLQGHSDCSDSLSTPLLRGAVPGFEDMVPRTPRTQNTSENMVPLIPRTWSTSEDNVPRTPMTQHTSKDYGTPMTHYTCEDMGHLTQGHSITGW